MHIFVAGATGFIGRYLTQRFLDAGYRVTASGTRAHCPVERADALRYVPADLTEKGPWQQTLAHAHVVVNLTGRTLFHRWTTAYKSLILESRVLSTKNIVEGLRPSPETLLINASAVGFYGSRGDDLLDEKAPPGTGFLAHVCRAWEAAALEGEERGIRVVCARFGIVLGKGGGAVEKLVFPFRYFVGGPLGSGKQWVSWIHIRDLWAGVQWIMTHPELKGPVNFCSENPVTNRRMAQGIGRILGRPARVRVPESAIRMAMGEMGSALLSSQRCVPAKLSASGFQFAYPDMESALFEILKQ